MKLEYDLIATDALYPGASMLAGGRRYDMGGSSSDLLAGNAGDDLSQGRQGNYSPGVEQATDDAASAVEWRGAP